MSKQLKVIIIIVCIGLGLFGNQITDMLDGVRNRPSGVTVVGSEPTPELKEAVKGIPLLITGPDAAVDKIQISDYFNFFLQYINIFFIRNPFINIHIQIEKI